MTALDVPAAPVVVQEEAIERYQRSPRDVLHVIVYGAVVVVTVVLLAAFEDSILGFEHDVVELFSFLTNSLERIVAGLLEVVSVLLVLGVAIVLLVRRRFRVLGYVVLASVVASLLAGLVDWLLDRDDSLVLANEVAQRAGLQTEALDTVQAFAQIAAVFTVLSPFAPARWRRAGAVTLGVMVVLRLLASTYLPGLLVVALPLGGLVGAAVLLVFGRPDRRPTPGAIRAALAESGLAPIVVHPAAVDARGSTPYFADLADGSRIFVKVLGEEERSADLMFRLYRFLRLKHVGDDRPFSSLRRTVEHEAFVSLLARDVGVRTPRMRGVMDVGADSLMLAYDLVEGRSVDALEPAAVTDDLMRSVWEQVAVLRRYRIAHRDLRRANVFVGEGGEPWMIDFGFSELAVDRPILDADVAQLLASFAVVVGAERAVGPAVAVLGAEAVAGALPRLQLRALSGATQTALKEHKGLLGELQQEVMRQTGTEALRLEPLERVNRRTIVTMVVLAAAIYFLFPQFADLPEIVDQVRDANWGWLPLVVLASLWTYLGATASLSGAIPERLAVGPTFMAQVGSSFASKLAPAGLGGMALNIRFLQKQGVDQAVAVSGVGLNSATGLVGHLSLVAVFFVWAGRDAFDSFRLPDPKWFVLGIGIALALVLVGIVVPVTRRLLVGRLVPILRRAGTGVLTVARRPAKLALLLGGSMVVTMSYLTTLYLSAQAFGGGLSFATVGAVYLVGSAVATAAPTPGGLGAMEAALIAGLVGAGMDNAVAVPAVFLYRLATFWLPIVPGWLSFTWLQRREYV